VETQSVRKINWLAVANIGSGVLACLLCFPSLVGAFLSLIIALSGYRLHILPIQVIDKYFGFVNENPSIFWTSSIFGLVALIIGLISILFLKGKQSKKFGLAGIVLGILGIVGNLFTILVLAMH